MTDEVMFSTSVTDTNVFLHQMVSFWKSLDWPDTEQAFGYGLKHFEVTKFIRSNSLGHQQIGIIFFRILASVCCTMLRLAISSYLRSTSMTVKEGSPFLKGYRS